MRAIHQLEFSDVLAFVKAQQKTIVEMSVKGRKEKTHSQVAVALLRATAEESVSFSTYAVMVAVANHVKPPTLVKVAAQVGYSYHAVCKLVERSHWLEKVDSVPLKCLKLTVEGCDKMRRIRTRLERYV